MEIKVGDKVKVSEDAPRLYSEGRIDWEAAESTVDRIDGDAAEIRYICEDNDEPYSIVLPTKYLIKVDAEAKDGLKPIMNAEMQLHKAFQKLMADGIDASKKRREEYIKFMKDCMSGGIYTQDDFLKDFDPMEHRIDFSKRGSLQKIAHSATVEEFNNKPLDWPRYEADLAKEIALECVRQGSYGAGQAAEYAAKTAKQIVKHLKENK